MLAGNKKFSRVVKSKHRVVPIPLGDRAGYTFSAFRVSPVSDLFFEGEYKGMSEILTAAQVAEIVRDAIGEFPFQNTKQFKRIALSHEAFRDLYDALLQGATAQRVATLMDEADQARVEIERLNDHARQHVRIAKLEKERDAALGAIQSTQKIMAEFKHIYPDGFPGELKAEPEHLASQVTALCNHQRCTFQNFCDLIAERDGLRRAIEAFSKAYSDWPSAPDERHQRPTLHAAMDALRALAAVPAPVAQQGKSHAHQWFKNGDYREDSIFGISCPVWACGSCKITCSATDKPSENL